MSRTGSKGGMGFAAVFAKICAIVVCVPAAALAQEQQPTLTAEEVSANAEAAYGPPPPEPKCAPSTSDEIVVCAEEEDQDQFRVKSSSELDPTSEEAIKDGLPRAPDVGGPGIFKGKPTVSGLCFIPPCPKDPAYIVDFSELPETPEGSDADRVGRGLAPRENQVQSPEIVSTVAEDETQPEG